MTRNIRRIGMLLTAPYTFTLCAIAHLLEAMDTYREKWREEWHR